FGLEPDMTVVEIWPGPGWYSRVIAPVLKEGGGVFYAAQLPVSEEEPRFKSMLDAYFAEFGDTDVYGEVRASTFAPDEEIAPPGSADMVLTFRNVHNWVPGGRAEAAFAAFYEALKPGGVLGVVDHRADGTELPNDGSKGYLYTDDVIAMAQSAGFDFDTASEINANANDTKDHPFGVWTLPPVSRQSDVSGVEDPEFDGAKYKAIGESDRFTLKFRKPIAADGALIE
ncbi:MAG: methyltransferase, partial [Pseudomonadota bacterium]